MRASRLSIPLAILSLALSDAAAAQGFHLDFEPQVREVILDTDFTQIKPTNAAPVNIVGGVFRFRNVRIPHNVTVRGTGSNPMIWIVAGDFVVDGLLSVSGGIGSRVDTLSAANFPVAGGVGNCGGGDGGDGSPNAASRSLVGGRGVGAGQSPHGGAGGLLWCLGGMSFGSGGGGGSFATEGDPWFKVKAGPGGSFQQQVGVGGLGGSGPSGSPTRTLPGGAAGVGPFIDNRPDNDFWGVTFDLNRRIPVFGELALPQGGQGGGGGGDYSVNCFPNDPNFTGDAKGGGGGGGGGVLVVLALGRVVIGPTGSIQADGGDGGGGEQAGSSNRGGSGGGGSGGMVLVFGQEGIDLHTHGETYANDDYSFAISADGGGGLGGKYGSLGSGPLPAPGELDRFGFGGFGGMGVVQLYVPFGGNGDGTNTILDDGIRVFQNGLQVFGQEKQRYIAWRGFPDANGVMVDDFGNPTNIGDGEGDIRPTPVLFPIFR